MTTKANIEFEIEEIIEDRETIALCRTNDILKVIEICDLLEGDFNVTVWIDNVFYGVYQDPNIDELYDIFKSVSKY
ncbi:hypothetical protein [Bacillus atrophaeus]|uniref:hypothetical protein n=1 Tax=Bacillus atrophaeus TaxID=1452 RepID=UPI0022805326|nr:hypothetical protein [Bacillus atrophaeus]MCY8958145.1 hypothetical protein [Bacillus atrophaeus]MCY8963718.1 hypothetical protein [Bacillus atrophaeus]MCY9161219.1 hypothetical protein [Bacillus atrophaeus]MCY9440262.1 hypothetical protein [Bacillus atrophaeus]MEC0648542.1 hypothetical protein [Bacillus atrophaeus]